MWHERPVRENTHRMRVPLQSCICVTFAGVDKNRY